MQDIRAPPDLIWSRVFVLGQALGRVPRVPRVGGDDSYLPMTLHSGDKWCVCSSTNPSKRKIDCTFVKESLYASLRK